MGILVVGGAEPWTLTVAMLGYRTRDVVVVGEDAARAVRIELLTRPVDVAGRLRP